MLAMILLAFGEFAPIIVILFIALVIVGAIFGARQARQRQEALAQLAASWGLRFDADKDRGMDERFSDFGCLRRGSDRYAFNIMEGGRRGRHVVAFDYHYETESRDSKGRRDTTDHYFSAVIVDSGLPLKPLTIRPEGFFDRIGEFLGFDDIDFELNEFSRKFYVKSPDRKWAFDVIHQATMEFLLASPVFSLEFAGPHVIAHRDSRFDVEEFADALAVVEGMLDRFPEYLLRELREGTR